jgi:hypothetical protein
MSIPVRQILPSPGRLVSNGRFNHGTFNHEFTEVNPLDAEIGRIFPYPRSFKNFRLKEWQHFALVNEDYYISLALFNAKTLALAQVCLYDRKSGSIHFYEKKTLPRNISLPDNLWNGYANIDQKGFIINIHNELAEGVHTISFEIGENKDLPGVKGKFTCFEDMRLSEPIVVCLPLKKQRAMYSHKYVCPIEGELIISEKPITFSRKESYGLVDIHKGYYPFVMKWHWATAGGFHPEHALVGLNLTNNQVQDQDAYNENCIWLNGRLNLLPPVRFTFNKEDLYKPWRIHDQYEMVNLTFTPEVIRTVDINAIIVKTRYRGPFGSFSGNIKTVGGDVIEVDNFFGMCEDFYLQT